MAKYMILIYGDEQRWAARSPQERQEVDEAHRAFAGAAGPRVLAGAELEAAATATTLRADPAGQLSITDGPFLETKEVLGGYYLIEAADLDEALEIAKQVPAPFGGVEVRPVWPTR